MKIPFPYIFLLIFGVLLNSQVFSQSKSQNNNSNVGFNEEILNEPKGIFDVTLVGSDPTCYGVCDGFITVDVSPNPGPIQYPVHLALVNPCNGGDSIVVDGLIATDFPFKFDFLCGCATQYTVRVKDNDGHRKSRNKGVTNPPELSISDYSVTNLTCPGACDGAISILNIDNASFPVTYDWSPNGFTGDGTDTYSDLCANTYSVTVTDDIGCQQDTVFILTAPPAIVIDSVVFTAVFCAGGSGTITVYASGGTPPFQYNIGLGYQASNTFSGLAASTYTITVQDANLCTTPTAPITLTENSTLVLSGVVTNVNCFGGATGSINLTVSGGTGPYSYNWSNAFPGQDPVGLIAGTYDVTVSDSFLCTNTASFTVTEPTDITITQTHTTPCFGASNGAIDITVLGGTPCPGYTYIWSNGAITQDLAGIAAGTYTVTVTDCNLCTKVFSYTLVQNTQITITLTSQTNYTCFGSPCMGAINITVTGGSPCPGYTYLWSNGATTEDLTNLCFGSYTVTVTDCIGCTRTRTITITRPTQITINLISLTNVTCFGACNGAIDINPTGGTPGYTYQWTGGITTQDRTNLCAGSYTVTVTDSRGCTNTRTFVITQPPDITITPVSQTNVLCFGACNGAIDVTIGGGTPPYTLYSWSGPSGYSSSSAVTPDISNLCAGVYTLTITDSKPCTKTYSVTITEPAVALTASITTQTNVSCRGGNNGSATVTGVGGTGAYTYDWSPNGYTGDGTPTYSNLIAGTYNVTVTDANLCTTTTSVTITQPAVALTASTTQINVKCRSENTGSATVTGAGGTGAYTYDWAPNGFTGDGTITYSNLIAGIYTVTVTDANLCTATSSVTITQPAVALSASISSQTNVKCRGGNTGSATVLGAGGTGAYSYDWSPNGYTGDGTPTYSNLIAGTYNVTITDANLCTATTSVTITEPAVALTASISSQTNILCRGANTGSATVSGIGGTGAYTYDWSPNGYTGDGTPTYSNLIAGTYNVTVTDVNLCTATTSVTITQPAVGLTASISSQTNVKCRGGNTGSATVLGAGGTGAYSYDWSPNGYTGDGTPTYSNLIAGTYNVTVTDVNLCTATTSVTITQPAVALSASITGQVNVKCRGGNTGSATVAGAGGTGAYTYDWSPNGYTGDGTITYSNLIAGTYNVTVTDANLCTATTSVTITQPAVALTASITSQTNILCRGANTGSATVTAAGGTGAYTYDWSPNGYTGDGTITYSNLIAGTYTVTVTDANLCAATASVTITEPAVGVTASITGQVNVMCRGGNTGSATVLGAGGTGAYSYDWSPNGYTGDGTPTYSNLIAGIYNVTVTDANLCTATAAVTITQPAVALTASITSQTNVLCRGANTGSATVTGAGGTGAYTYDWSPNGYTGDGTITYFNLIAGTYTVTVTDANLCVTTASVTITQPALDLTAVISGQTNVQCFGECNGTATVLAGGGTAGYSYLWCNGQTTNIATNLCAGVCDVTVTDGNLCTKTASVTITEPTDIIVLDAHTNIAPCFGNHNGTITITASGGSPNYLYDIGSGNQLSNSFTGLWPGSYIVTVTDANGCTKESNTIVIVEPNDISIDSVIVTNVLPCFGDNNGSITVYPAGGNPPYVYDIGFGNQPDSIFTNLAPGTYNVTVTDALLCTTTIGDTTITEPTQLIITAQSSTNITPCNGDCNGTFTITASGGNGALSYDLGTGPQATGNFANLCANNYIVTVTDGNGCTIVSNPENITEPPLLSITSEAFTDVTPCHGGTNGTITIVAAGGQGALSYDLGLGPQANGNFTNLLAGTYIITVTDGLGCFVTSSAILISEPTGIQIDNLTSTNVTGCFGNSDGTITVTASGGTAPLSYDLGSGSQANGNFTGLPAGTYIVTITDQNLCTLESTPVIITEPVDITIDSQSSTDVTPCFGGTNGTITIAASGGTGVLSYDLGTGGQATGNFTNLTVGTYVITITDANSCTKTTNTITIAEPPALQITSLSSTDIAPCFGDSSGTISLTVTGGTPPYTWDAGLGSTAVSPITGLPVGTYNVTVTDFNGCTLISNPLTIIEPPLLSSSFTSFVQVACNGGCTGSLTITPTGGTAPYDTYLWDPNVGNDSTVTNLCAGLYSVTITDHLGCTTSNSYQLTDNSDLVIIISDTNHVTCSTFCDGSATVTATGGTGIGTYTYIWDDPGLTTTSTVSNLCQGTYSVIVYDANLCSRTTSVQITDAAALMVRDSIIPISCSGLCDASIILIPSGGTPPYGPVYQWSITGETDSIASGLCPNMYYYTVTDSHGCVLNDSTEIVDPGIMMANITIENPILCHGVCIGELLTTPSGSLGPYTYLWSDGQTDSLAINLCGGNFHVTVTGQGGCFVVDSLILPEPDTMLVSFIDTILVACGGDSTGSITASVIGGTPIYTYQWDANAGNATTAMIDSLSANIYSITVTDANGCAQSLNFELTDTSLLSISLDSGMVSCYGRCDGWATITAVGATMPYSYLWNISPTDTLPTVDSLCAGQYTITVYDANLCSRVKLVDITQPDSIFISVTDSSVITCASLCNGSLAVNVIGGTIPYDYSWNYSITDTLSVDSNLCTGMHQVNITDGHGCRDSLLYFLSAPPIIVDTLTPQNALCNTGTNDGAILVSISGGVPPYTYLWSNSSTIIPLPNLPTGDYWLTITDSLGCQKIDSATINAGITVNAIARWDTIICYGDSVQIEGFGSSIFTWSPTTYLSDSTVFNPWTQPTQTTTYYFTAFNNICFDVDSVTIQVHPQLGLDAGPDQSILYDHSTTISAISTDPLATYLWYPSIGLQDTTLASTVAEPPVTTTYLVFATSSFGCVEVDTLVITVIPRIVVPSGITPNGDGVNDTWEIDMIGFYPNCEVEIFNRWGEKLFYSRGYPDSGRWDGNYKGKPLPTGTYYFVINLHDEATDLKPITGPITIMR